MGILKTGRTFTDEKRVESIQASERTHAKPREHQSAFSILRLARSLVWLVLSGSPAPGEEGGWKQAGTGPR